MQRLLPVCTVAVALLCPAMLRADEDDDLGIPDRLEMRELARGNTKFALALHARLRTREGNLFYSPFSISSALAMTSAGARGKTLEQMETVLGLPAQNRLHPAAGHLLAQLNAGGKRGYQLSIANSLWGQSGYRFRKEFLDLLDTHYSAGLQPVDYKNATEQARRTINQWVEKQTSNRIKELVPPGLLNDQTKLVLTNAIYFKGDWARPFQKASTKEEDFHLSATQKIKAPLMYQSGSFGYGESAGVQVLELPYVGKDLSMFVLLPRKVGGLAELEKALTPERLKQTIAAVRQRRVYIYLPRFTFASQFRLKDELSALGMQDAFTLAADFSGMDGTSELFLRDVVHKAFVDVNEKGTEAAAATGVVMETKSTPVVIPTFRADRPFLFLIRDNRFDNVLFLGRLANPTKG